MAEAIVYDPFDYSIDADPHPIWRRMRAEAPLYRNDEHDFWALSRFQDVLDASVDTATYSSAYGTVLDMMQDEPGQSPMMIFQDPPEHTRLRKLVSRAFSPRRISELEPRIREIARSYLDPFVGSAGFDYVADFGAKLPVMVIGSLLGVPVEDQDEIREWTDQLLHRDPGEIDSQERLDRVNAQLFGFFARYIEERRSSPRDDMMTDLVQAEIELENGSKRKMSDIEILAFIGLLSGAGNETVARLAGWAGALLARYPEERRKLVEDPRRIPNAVEELLRYEAPSPVQGRRTTREIECHGERLPVGAKVLLLTGSAGRDERQYEDPDRFDVDRPIDRHVSLGYGAHFCLGASLARMEGRIILEETLARFPEWEGEASGTEMVHTSTVRGYAKLPIRL
jgi:cytochrome P450